MIRPSIQADAEGLTFGLASLKKPCADLSAATLLLHCDSTVCPVEGLNLGTKAQV